MSTIDESPAAGLPPQLSPQLSWELSWERFWQLIDLIGGEPAVAVCATFGAGCERLSEVLAAGPVEEILGFGERFAEALYRLDREEFGTQRAVDPGYPGESLPLSDDGFLYARAAVVAAGRAAYERVLGEPELFAAHSFRSGEPLLYVHEEAYEAATGEEWDHATRYNYESCSNREGWPTL
ncbi:DUF4240 domain-containing protein [Kitasatospora purpeofusca]|uniref:DUF4240 domain-containing protein n=1 Tax=Kitasatospora purpeofusca TaxID=67352 RepID=UPI002A5A9AFF|nr:DUF4240 domain-containing protein [Kitasatospora purpeofusca]MDY0812618.1 DUF4240 domain-containing protein [Kitasatospora purpeofusca]